MSGFYFNVRYFAAIGIEKLNVLPASGLLSTQMRPPGRDASFIFALLQRAPHVLATSITGQVPGIPKLWRHQPAGFV